MAQEISLEQLIVDAAGACCDDWGPSKTTVADIAKRAGVSRATIYRVFPGGRDAIFDALRRTQIRVFFTELSSAVADAEGLDEIVATSMHRAACALRDDVEVQRDLANDPGSALTTFTGKHLERLFTAARVFIGPLLEPHLGRRGGAELAEWMTRIVISYSLEPSPFFDPCDRSQVDHLVRERIAPAFERLSTRSTPHLTSNVQASTDRSGVAPAHQIEKASMQ